MDRLTKKDRNGKYYTVASEMGLCGKDVNPITNWIEDLEERNFGKPIDKLGKLEDLLENADTIRIIKRDGVRSMHIDMILDDETYPIAEQLFGKEKVIDFDK